VFKALFEIGTGAFVEGHCNGHGELHDTH